MGAAPWGTVATWPSGEAKPAVCPYRVLHFEPRRKRKGAHHHGRRGREEGGRGDEEANTADGKGEVRAGDSRPVHAVADSPVERELGRSADDGEQKPGCIEEVDLGEAAVVGSCEGSPKAQFTK